MFKDKWDASIAMLDVAKKFPTPEGMTCIGTWNCDDSYELDFLIDDNEYRYRWDLVTVEDVS